MSLTKFTNKKKNKRQNNTDYNRSHNRKIKGKVSFFKANVPWQPTYKSPNKTYDKKNYSGYH